MLRETQKQMEFRQTNAIDNWVTPSAQVAPEIASISSSMSSGKSYLLDKSMGVDESSGARAPANSDKLYTKSQEILKLRNKYNRYRDSKTSSG